jgi:uncharacterized membrane protein
LVCGWRQYKCSIRKLGTIKCPAQSLPKTQNPKPHSIQSIEQHYSGPIPPPSMLEKYNQVIPGSAERILKMAEEQAEHRRVLEKTAIRSDVRNSTLGIICALVISLGVLFLAYYAIRMNQPTAGTIIGAIGLGSLVGTFVYGTKSRRAERQDRLK